MHQSLSRIKSLFGFTAIPFTPEVKAGDHFVYPQFDDALTRLRYVADRRGIASITAPPGVGKSTLIRALLENLGRTQFFPAYVPETTCSTVDLFRAIAVAFEITPPFFKIHLIRQIKERLVHLSQNRKVSPLLVIDDAHILHRPFFDELRILANFDVDSSNHLTILLAGQLTLDSSLRLNINESLAQRIVAKIRLSPWDRDICQAYILHRLKLVGRSAPLFLPDAFEAIYTYSCGTCRKIDRVAETAIYLAAARKQSDIDLETVNLAISELEQ